MAEKLSVIMAKKSLERADVAILPHRRRRRRDKLDANIAGYASRFRLLGDNRREQMGRRRRKRDEHYLANLSVRFAMAMKFLDWKPDRDHFGLDRPALQRSCRSSPTHTRRNKRIQTSRLNRFRGYDLAAERWVGTGTGEGRFFPAKSAIHHAGRHSPTAVHLVHVRRR